MTYKGFHTQDGGTDGDLEDILSYLSELDFQKSTIEVRLLTHGDRTCKYFSIELGIVTDMCRSILAKLDQLK